MEGKQWIISDVVKQTGIEPHVLRYWEKELHLNIPRNEFGHRYYLDKHIELFRQIHTMKDGGFQLKAILTLIPAEFLTEEYKQAARAGDENIFANMTVQMPQQTKEIKTDKPATIVKQVETVKQKTAAQQLDSVVNGTHPTTKDNPDQNASSNLIIMNKKNDRFEVLGEDMVESDQMQGKELDHIQEEEPVLNKEKLLEQLNKKKEMIRNDNTDYVENDKIAQFKDILTDVMLEVLETRDQKLGVQISDKVIKQMDYLMRLQDEFEEERFKRLDETIRIYQKEREAAGKQKQSRHIFFKKKSRS